MSKNIHSDPTQNQETKLWEVKITSAEGKPVKKEGGFKDREAALDWSLKQALSSTAADVAKELPPMKGRSTLSL